jgi:hypothetical protein
VAHRAIAAALAIAGIVLIPARPLVALILFGAALAIFLNGRGAFGSGMYRAIVAFVSSLWLALVGVVATLLGQVPAEPGGNVLLLPGLILLGVAASLFAGSLFVMVRARRRRGTWPAEVKGRRPR